MGSPYVEGGSGGKVDAIVTGAAEANEANAHLGQLSKSGRAQIVVDEAANAYKYPNLTNKKKTPLQ